MPGDFFNQEDDGSKERSGQQFQGLIFADLSGESGTDAVVGPDEFFAEGMWGQIVVPEVLQQNHFLGQGGAVRGGGDKAESPFGGFLGALLFSGWCGNFRRDRYSELDGGNFGYTVEIFIRGKRFCRFPCSLGGSRRCCLLWCGWGLRLGLVLGFIDDIEIMLIIPLA